MLTGVRLSHYWLCIVTSAAVPCQHRWSQCTRCGTGSDQCHTPEPPWVIPSIRHQSSFSSQPSSEETFLLHNDDSLSINAFLVNRCNWAKCWKLLFNNKNWMSTSIDHSSYCVHIVWENPRNFVPTTRPWSVVRRDINIKYLREQSDM